MRFKNFMRKFIGTGEVQALEFGPEHFQEAGILPAPWGGMPLLEAYQLINKWNRSQAEPRFLYWLD
jgi:hypothetical protein